MSDEDTRFMRRALRLAARAAGRTSPNPMVGTVIVRGTEIVGEGYHRAAGEPHAEVSALTKAGDAARGATLYTTLEPCAHHGRTPPCVDAILAAARRRGGAAVRDPDPRTDGQGFPPAQAPGGGGEPGVPGAGRRAPHQGVVRPRRGGRPVVAL